MGKLSIQILKGDFILAPRDKIISGSVVTVTSDTITASLYIDGEFIESGAVGSHIDSTKPIHIGSGPNVKDQANNNLKNLRIWDRPLTAQEVKAL